ncbi:MAG: CARDB domain-containing protein, partial [Gallionella sp.]
IATSGRWTDNVYLSLDGTLSADDLLVGSYQNGSALAPTESYSADSVAVNIPIRFRGNAYLIVVTDANNNINEYPNDANNIKAAKFYVDPVPFADLVTSDIVAPDQMVHGASMAVNYKVTNKGSATTQGNAANVSSWTDTIWLARDKTQPAAWKGDILLGSVTHQGNLAVGQDYLGTAQVTIPDGTLTGQYFVTVWSDTYDTILEDSLASNINLDDPTNLNSSNYKARPISVLGATQISPPDLTVTDLSALTVAQAGGSYNYSYTVKNLGSLFTGNWTDQVYLTNNSDLSLATEKWLLGSFQQNRTLADGESYSVSQSLQLGASVRGQYVVVKTDIGGNIAETSEINNLRSIATNVTAAPADLQVSSIVTQPQNFSGEETTVSWTVTNSGADVWAGTQGWVDSIYFSPDPNFIASRATALGAVVHSNAGGLTSGSSYTATAKVKLPPGTDGVYYIYVITDSYHYSSLLNNAPDYRAQNEVKDGDARDTFYATSAFEGLRNDNNMGRASLNITYREADLQVDAITVSNPQPSSGQPLTVTWTVTNRGTRDTRTNAWQDGIYLSRDASLDSGDYLAAINQTALVASNQLRYLKPGESYTKSATFNLPESISGDFYIIVKTDTTSQALDPLYYPNLSTIRSGLAGIGFNPDSRVAEFKDEGNNTASIALPILLATPPDLQVAQVTAPASVIAGQPLQVSYRVANVGGNTPTDQQSWNDMVYLSKDRFLDITKDRYLGYVSHSGGLAANGSYDATLNLTAPRDMEGSYYIFVITDPANAWGTGASGKVREFGNEQNNATATVQPIVIETPPPADLKVTNVVIPAQASVGDDVAIQYTIINDSNNTALGNWTDAIYLSSDSNWDLGDKLLGKVDHTGPLAGQGSYTGSLTAKLPPLKDGSWRIIVRPDLFNDVYEGAITYTDTGLNIAPGEANNRQASGSAIQVNVPLLTVANTLQTTLSAGQSRLYKVSVAPGETLRVTLDSSAIDGANELYIRYGDIPTGYAYDASYSTPVSPDQQVVIPSTKAGDYYVLVKSRSSASASTNIPITLRADLLPLSITKVTPDQGGVGDAAHRWVTLDIYGAHFQPGALIKLSSPGIFEVEPDRWQVLDATHIRSVFDLRNVPYGLYDVTVTNPDGQQVTEAYRYLVERAIEADVTIGIGGLRTLNPGDSATYSVALQSLTNVDTPYVRFDIGTPEMGYSQDILGGLPLPYVVFGTNVGGSPTGQTIENNGTSASSGPTQSFGVTPTTGTSNIPWASLDGVSNTNGINLAPGYATDIGAGGFAGMSFNIQTYPGLAEWLAYDFEGLRARLYQIRPDWKAQGLLDGGVNSLDNITPGLTAQFLSHEPDTHITKLENLALPFAFNVVGAATPLTRDEFIAEQTTYAKQLRTAILADTTAPGNLSVLAADESQWVQGWLAALETAGLLRPVDQAPPIRDQVQVISLNATLASGILLGKGGDSYRTQADILGFFAKVQSWYGDTAKWAGDPAAKTAVIDHYETRTDNLGNSVDVPVYKMVDSQSLNQNAAQQTHFINFNVFAGSQAELEYLRQQGLLDAEFKPIGVQALNLAQYLQLAAMKQAAQSQTASLTGPQGMTDSAGNVYVPADTPLPYNIGFNNPSDHALGQLRIVTQLDVNLDPRSLRLGDLKLGDINIHLPTSQANFQGDFDFTATKGFILRISAGIDISSHIATWLIQAINPDTGEVMHDATRGLLAPPTDPTQSASAAQKRGYVSYTVQNLSTAISGASITSGARVIFDDAPPVDTATVTNTLDAAAPVTTVTATALGIDTQGKPGFDVKWHATDDASGIKHITVYVAENGGDFKIWQRQVSPDQTQAVFIGTAGSTYEFLAVATDNAGNLEAAQVANAVLPDDGSRQAVLDALGADASLTQTAQTPLAAADRSYVANALFQQSTQQLPGFVATALPGDLQTVLAPFTMHGFADGFAASAADIGALAMVELPDHSMLVSAGTLRNEVYRFSAEGGRSTTPLFTLNVPVLDMAVDAVGQLWVLTGNEML